MSHDPGASSRSLNINNNSPGSIIDLNGEDSAEYIVEAVRDSRINTRQIDPVTKRRGLLQYKIQWTGYPGEDTWEPYTSVMDTAHDSVLEFHRKYANKPSVPRKCKLPRDKEIAAPASPRASRAALYLPLELWAMVFEHIAHCDYQESLCSKSRLNRTRDLQQLGLVCREWRVYDWSHPNFDRPLTLSQDIVRPLVLRHITLVSRDGAAAEYLRSLIHCHEGSQSEGRLKSTHIKTLWLGKWCSREFDEVFLRLVPLLDGMHTICCISYLPTDTFRHIAERRGNMVTAMHLTLSRNQVFRTLSSVALLNNLAGLSLNVVLRCPGDEYYPEESPLSYEDLLSTEELVFPQLQRLHICGEQTSIPVPLVLLAQPTMDRLRFLRLETDDTASLNSALHQFLWRHGAKLTLFGLMSKKPHFTRSIFALLPKLQILWVTDPASVGVWSRAISDSVREISLVPLAAHWTLHSAVNILEMALEQFALSPTSKLLAIRLGGTLLSDLDKSGHGHRKTRAAREKNDGVMNDLARLAGFLKQRGLQLWDMEGRSMDADIAAWSAEKAARPPSQSLRPRKGVGNT